MKRVFVSFVLLSFIIRSEGICDHLVTDFSQTDCIAKQTNVNTYYYWVDEKKSCVPTCLPYNQDGYFKASCPCPPGYVCSKRCSGTLEDAQIVCEETTECRAKASSGPRSKCIDMCVPGDISCMSYHANTTDFRDTAFTALKFKPSCDNAGNWRPKQCKGGKSGRCLCFDAVGNRVYGQAPYEKSKDMTCECSRRKAELKAAGRFHVAFHCDAMGNFEALQCDSGLCWCVKPTTGRLISPVVPEKAMSRLPCYDFSKVGSQYLRQCDSAEYAMAKIANTLKVHGVSYVNLGVKLCDGDGAFGAYAIEEGIAYCTWRDGKRLGTFQTDSSSDINKVNCNCARDTKMYSTPLTCSGEGNYAPVQSIIVNGFNQYFCVDDDGFAKTDFFPVNLGKENCSSYY